MVGIIAPKSKHSDTNVEVQSSYSIHHKLERHILLLVTLILIVLGIYAFVYLDYFDLKQREIEIPTDNILPQKDAQCSLVSNIQKFDCHPENGATESRCLERGCCWKQLNQSFPPLNVPTCFYPDNYDGYRVESIACKTNYTEIMLQRGVPSGFPNDVKNVRVLITPHDEALEIKITDADNERFESPYPKAFHFDPFVVPDYEVVIKYGSWLIIQRKGVNKIIFSTDLSKLVFSDQFLQLSASLPSKYVYGLGEHQAPFLKSTNWTRWTLKNSDQAPIANTPLYGSHPFYLVMEDGGNATGVALINSNIMDIILQPTPAITFRPIGGIFHFLIFARHDTVDDPAPRGVVKSYTRWIGVPELPPYWSLGFHLCRFGYNSLNRTKLVWQRTRDAGIPFDVQWNDIDYMKNNNDFTYDATRFEGLPEFVDELHEEGMHYMMMVDPGISNSEPPNTYPPYDDGLKYDIFVKNSSGQLFIAKVWNKVSTVFPDFTHPNIDEYWTKQLTDFHNLVKFDGVWIDMNEPSNFLDGTIKGCPSGSPLDNPPYIPGDDGPIYKKTLCMSALHNLSTHYNVHNLYGITEAEATNKALRSLKKRPFIISRATFIGQGHYSAHWTGDVFSTWDAMQKSIPGIMNFNMFGIPMVGADICGFNDNTTVELCARWSSLGAFYPFSRNHNTDNAIDQDPVALGPDVISAARNALFIRYKILPYLYTWFVFAHLHGQPLVRPLLMEFPKDVTTYTIDTQFLLGPGFLVIPVLQQGATSVNAYFPKGTWYDFNDYSTIRGPTHKTLDAPIDKINVAVRGGTTLIMQSPNVTTTLSRENNFQLFVALDPVTKSSIGHLFWDDGVTVGLYQDPKMIWNYIEFNTKNNNLFIICHYHGYVIPMLLDRIEIIGVPQEPRDVYINGQAESFSYDTQFRLISIPTSIDLLQNSTISWIF